MIELQHTPDEIVQNRHISEREILLGDHAVDVLRRCELERCHIVLLEAKGSLSLASCKLLDCTIEAKTRLKESQFFGSDFIRCKFKGKYLDMDFGRSPWPVPGTDTPYEHGELVDCDFTEATLDLCRFFNVDVSRQKFASWPQFVVSAENRFSAWQRNRTWPGRFDGFIGLAKNQNSVLSAITGTKSDFMKRFAVTEEELEQSLEAIGGVIR